MKRRSLPIAVVALAVMVALGSLGVVYGAWSQNAYVQGNVSTATLGVAFDNNPGYAPLADSLVGSIQCAPSIGNTSVGNDTLTLTVDNAAPGGSCRFFNITLRNTGTIPVNYTTDYASDPAATWINLGSSTLGLNSGSIPVGGYNTGQLNLAITDDAPFNAANDTFQWTITATQ